jgi:hypothetical protein
MTPLLFLWLEITYGGKIQNKTKEVRLEGRTLKRVDV